MTESAVKLIMDALAQAAMDRHYGRDDEDAATALDALLDRATDTLGATSLLDLHDKAVALGSEMERKGMRGGGE